MQTTTNIGLKTYEANDPTDWLGEFNYNMNKIDTAVGTQNQAITLIGANVTTAVNTANTASATASEALQTAGTKASIDDNVASASTTYSSNKINDLIEGIEPGTEIDDTVTSTTKTWSSSKINTQINTKASINDTTASATTTYSSNKINTELSAKAGKISYDNTTSTTLTFSQDPKNERIYNATVNNLTEGYYYFNILLGSSTGERCAFFEILENNTQKYSKYYYKNPITRQVISDIIYIPAGYSIRVSALSTAVFSDNTTGNLIKVG